MGQPGWRVKYTGAASKTPERKVDKARPERLGQAMLRTVDFKQ